MDSYRKAVSKALKVATQLAEIIIAAEIALNAVKECGKRLKKTLNPDEEKKSEPAEVAEAQ